MKLNAPVQFSAITLGPSVPLKGKAKKEQGMPSVQRSDLEGVETIIKTWLEEKKPELDKITGDRTFEAIIDVSTDQYSSHQRWNKKTPHLGLRFYEVEPDGSKTKLEVRWPTLSGGPTYPKTFESWAHDFLTSERKHVFNRLVKALKRAINNKNIESPLYEDR